MLSPVASTRAAGVKAFFPNAVLEALSLTPHNQDIQLARLTLSPFNGRNNVAVARALAAQQPLTVDENGLLEPASLLYKPLAGSIERRVRRIEPMTYTVEIRWSLDRAHPRVFCIDPYIDVDLNPDTPHLYNARHPTYPTNAICPYGPHIVKWNPFDAEHQYFLVHSIACWLANYAIWQATRRWLGLQASHSIVEIRRHHAGGQCWCGTGLPLADCHGNAGVFGLPRLPRRKK